MGTVLGILAVIGRILLIILLVLLILLLLLLFVPFRYRVHADGKAPGVYGEASVSWLLHFVSVTLSFSKGNEGRPDGKRMTIRVLGISPAERKRRNAARKKEEAREEKRRRIEEIKETDPERYEEMKDAALARKQAKAEEKLRRAEEARARKEAEEAERLRESRRLGRLRIYAKQRMGYFRRAVLSLTETVRMVFAVALMGIIETARIPALAAEKIGGAAEKAAAFFGKLRELLDFLADDRTAGAVGHVKRKLLRLIRHVLPRSADGDVAFGLGDPGTTGMVLAAVSAAYPLYGGRVAVNPDFDEKRFEGNLTCKGRIFLFYVLYIALSTIINGDVRFVCRKYKEMKEAS